MGPFTHNEVQTGQPFQHVSCQDTSGNLQMFTFFRMAVPFPGNGPKDINPEYEEEFAYKDGH